jgi:hypothetical protein
MYGTVGMAVGMVVGMIVRVSVVMLVHMLMRRTVFMQMVVHMFAQHLFMRMTMIMRRTIGMHMKMPAMAVAMFAVLHGLAVNGRFSCAATAYITHRFPPIPRRVL